MNLQRPLCDLERAFWLLDCGTSMNGMGVVTVAGPLTENLVRAALLRLQARHPFLRMRVLGEDRELRITEEGAQPIPLRVVRGRDPTDWQRIVEEELNRRFEKSAGYLSRVTLLAPEGPGARHTLVLTHHHVIADALSIVYVIRDLLTCIAALLSPASSDARAELPELPLPRSLPELLPRAARGLGRLGHMRAYFQKHIAQRPFRHARKLPIEQPAPPAERRNRVEQRVLAGSVLQALSARARAEGASLQGALSAALLLATAEVAFAGELAAATPTTVGCFTPVNLREKLEPPVGDDMGLYISQVTTFHQIIPPPPLWQLAKEVREQLGETLESGEQYLTLPLIGLFIPWGRDPGPRFIRRFDGGSPAALGLSNLARPPIPGHYGPLHIENLHLAVGVSIVGQLLAIVTTWEDQLTLNLVFAEPLVSRARAQRIADGALGHLRAAVGL